ncbi:MAG: TIR domain-containing protein [Pseudomonadota bacterium]|nr:TIR domain-containing protein [Pseudomonadota bacterium]
MFEDKSLLAKALANQATVCSGQQADEIAEIANVKKFAAGDLIAKSGDIGDELFYIVAGSVDIIIKDHLYKTRKKGQLVGEMALIDPGGVRSADIVAKSDGTQLACLTTKQFHDMAAQNPDHWRCIANELAHRLRQRDEMFLPPNEKKVVFVASSAEGAKRYITTITKALECKDRLIKPWTAANIFTPSISTLKNLENRANESDFAIALVTADDIRESRGSINAVARDNVIFEAGLFMGALETERVFLLIEQDSELRMPSDLSGISMLYFKNDAELHSKLDEISSSIQSKGLMYRFCRPIV